MSGVFVVDQERRPKRPVHPGYARWRLSHGKAAVLYPAPFTLILQQRGPEVQPAPLRLKLDPGSKATGLAVVDDGSGQVVWAAEVVHRGEEVRRALDRRRAVRRSRRQRHTRYRKPRFRNRRREPGWQPPSRLSRVQNVLTWVERLRRWCPIGAISLELVRFDTQRMQQPEISGVAYQQGELAGYEVRQYLLEKWGRRCAYCGASGVPLETLACGATQPWGLGPGEQSDAGLRALQHSQGVEDSGGVWASRGPGASEAAPQGCRGGQCDQASLSLSGCACSGCRWRLGRVDGRSGIASGGASPRHDFLDAACAGASTPEVLNFERIIRLSDQSDRTPVPPDVSGG